MRVFLTGASGFVGLALCDSLLARGAEVHGHSVAPPPDWATRALPRGVRWTLGDVTDGEGLRREMAAARPDLVIHAAAATADGEREAAGDAARVAAINVGGTANAVEAAAACGARRVVALGSGAIYGKGPEAAAMLDEATTAPTPRILYAITKLAAEQLALRLGEVHGVPVCAPRLGILWGRWEHRTGERATTSPLHQAVGRMRRGETAVLPLDARLPLMEGGDAAEALTRLALSEATGVVNVGPPKVSRLLDMAQALAGEGPAPRIGAPANVALFASERPPFAQERYEAACGPLPLTPGPEAAARYLAWLDAVGADAEIFGDG
ncbi:MAG: NAD(P)-dependent oxidoreductase [Pseudomonadota bacterium]